MAGGVPGLPAFDIVQAHDWHAALVPLLVKRAGRPVKTILTVHNLAFQGNFPPRIAQDLGLPRRRCARPDSLGSSVS